MKLNFLLDITYKMLVGITRAVAVVGGGGEGGFHLRGKSYDFI